MGQEQAKQISDCQNTTSQTDKQIDTISLYSGLVSKSWAWREKNDVFFFFFLIFVTHHSNTI